MNLPLSPPTDSLYKFMALAGLLLVGFALWISYSAVTHQHESLNKYLADQRNFQVDVEARWESLMPGRQPTTAPRSDTTDSEWKRRQAVLDLAAASVADETQSLKILLWLCGFASAVGGVTSTVGFILWHVHIQKPQDELLALQLRKARAEASRSGGTGRIDEASGAGEGSTSSEP